MAADGAQAPITPEHAHGGPAADSHADDDQDQAVRLHQADRETHQKKKQPTSASNTNSAELPRDITNGADSNTCGKSTAECLPEQRSPTRLVGAGAASATSPGGKLQDAEETCDGGEVGDGPGDNGGGSRPPASTTPTAPGDGAVVADDVQPSSAGTAKVPGRSSSNSSASENEPKPRSGSASVAVAADKRPMSSAHRSTVPFSATPSQERATDSALSSLSKVAAAASVQGESRKRLRQDEGMKGAREQERDPGQDLKVAVREVGVRKGRKARRRESIAAAAVVRGRDGSGGGGGGGCSRCGGGSGRGGGKRWVGAALDDEGGDAHSTIVWYRTIVACLTPSAS